MLPDDPRRLCDRGTAREWVARAAWILARLRRREADGAPIRVAEGFEQRLADLGHAPSERDRRAEALERLQRLGRPAGNNRRPHAQREPIAVEPEGDHADLLARYPHLEDELRGAQRRVETRCTFRLKVARPRDYALQEHLLLGRRPLLGR